MNNSYGGTPVSAEREPFVMKFDVATIKHLGLQMYSTLPSVIGEIVANCWDANATRVEIRIPDTQVDNKSEIIITDDGIGMTDGDIRQKYITVGRDRRANDCTDKTPEPFGRKVMGRKGIGKFSSFGIATEIEIESIRDGESSRFNMNYDEMLKKEEIREISFPLFPPTKTVSKGTRITLRDIKKFRGRTIPLAPLRRRLARRFSIIGAEHKFEVVINGKEITPEDRDLRRLLDTDMDGQKYLWEYCGEEVEPETGWTVNGWIGALKRSAPTLDDVDRGIVLMARGKLVQEPFIFEATVGQQYALSYLVGELHVEFVDGIEDTIGTSRNVLVWDTQANTALLKWGKIRMNAIAREWSSRRSKDNERRLDQNSLYLEFREKAKNTGNRRALRLADQLVRQAIGNNPVADVSEVEPVIQTSIDFLEFDAYWEMVEELTNTDVKDTAHLIKLFREWEIVESKEMARVTKGRIMTIKKLQELIDKDAMEVPTLHNFLKEFPWVIDPRWTLVADEIYYSQLLRKQFPESKDTPEENRRIDFLCVGESQNIVVVEIKRPSLRVSEGELNQIEQYVNFVRYHVDQSTDPDHTYTQVTGYLICGGHVNTWPVRQKLKNLASARIYVRRYSDLLRQVQKSHMEFLNRYQRLQEAKMLATEESMGDMAVSS